MTVMDKINYDVTFPSKIRDAVKKKVWGPFSRKEGESKREWKRDEKRDEEKCKRESAVEHREKDTSVGKRKRQREKKRKLYKSALRSLSLI